jgi:hypothetical protein
VAAAVWGTIRRVAVESLDPLLKLAQIVAIGIAAYWTYDLSHFRHHGGG